MVVHSLPKALAARMERVNGCLGQGYADGQNHRWLTLPTQAVTRFTLI
jgi:hypothetical protein